MSFSAMDDARLRQLQEAKLHILKYEGLRTYETGKKQLSFHSSQFSIRALVGPNKCGKSYTGTNEILNTVGATHQYRPNYVGEVYGRDCCVDFPTLREALIPIYRMMAPRKECKLDGLTYEGHPRIWPGLRGGTWETAYNKDERVLYLENGSKVEFKSYDQEPDSFAGPVRHVIRMDEEPPEFVFGENMARQLTEKINLFFTLTPLNYGQWLYGAIFDGHIAGTCFTVKLLKEDNPFINPEVFDFMEKTITDPAERAARLYGEPTYQAGKIYKDYGEANFIDPEPIPHWYHRSVVIDPHPEKATAVIWIAEDDRERYHVYREMSSTGTVADMCNEIIAKSAGEMTDIWLIDPSSKQKAGIRGQGSLIDEFRKYLPVIEANNVLDYGMECVKKAVTNKPGWGPSLLVHKTCPMTHWQMSNYSWQRPKADGQDRSKPSVVKKKDDFCDCIRYRLVMGSLKLMQRKSLRPSVALYGN